MTSRGKRAHEYHERRGRWEQAHARTQAEMRSENSREYHKARRLNTVPGRPLSYDEVRARLLAR